MINSSLQPRYSHHDRVRLLAHIQLVDLLEENLSRLNPSIPFFAHTFTRNFYHIHVSFTYTYMYI